MVIYYSWGGNTKRYAEELAAKKGIACFALVEKNNRRHGPFGFIKSGFQSAFKKETEVISLPDLSGLDELYLCSPIWASGMAPALRYCIKHAGLSGKKINFLFTCASAPDMGAIKSMAVAALDGAGCEIGETYAFVPPKKGEDADATVGAHIDTV